jgi:hypothetical protein
MRPNGPKRLSAEKVQAPQSGMGKKKLQPGLENMLADLAPKVRP